MNFKQAFKLAVKNLSTSKMRSFLTMLGIIMGVASVIILVSLIQGMSNDMTATFESMGTNLINVTVMGRGGNRNISADDIQKFADENSDVIDSVSPVVTISGVTAKHDSDSVSTSVTGCNEFYEKIRNTEVAEGRFISYVDVEKRHTVCLIGGYISQEFFGDESPVGKEIKLNNQTYTVIGLLTTKADNEEGSADDTIIIPYTSAARLSRMNVNTYAFSAVDKEHVDEAQARIEQKLLSIFNSSNYYRVFDQSEVIEQLDELTGTLSTVLVGIAAISLVVGGVGIMNIMLVSVTERTREIGIRKSLGAKRKDIMSQFVIEASTTSAAGGIIGIIVGIMLAYLIGGIMDLTVAPSIFAVVIAFSVSVAIGIIFGYFPAKKAAKLNPIEALRYD